MKYKEFTIPKKNGKTRKIVAPDDELKTYQRAQLLRVEEVFTQESILYSIYHRDTFHGFLKERNCVTAATKHIGYKATLMIDIKNFFDSVFINNMPKALHHDALLFHERGYAAQGFPTSPMIANVAAIPVIRQIHNNLLSIFGGDYALTIYADDIQVSVNKLELLKEALVHITKTFNHYGFDINDAKTRIRYARCGWRRILGVNVGATEVRATRRTMRKIRAAKHLQHTTTYPTIQHPFGRDKATVEAICQKASRSLGGLVTWSKCITPKIKKKKV